ncbi:MAG: hypothetical protein AVDCRST_MAG25-2744, partial [uncultured Rubrobacteraceae bacterium]
ERGEQGARTDEPGRRGPPGLAPLRRGSLPGVQRQRQEGWRGVPGLRRHRQSYESVGRGV